MQVQAFSSSWLTANVQSRHNYRVPTCTATVMRSRTSRAGLVRSHSPQHAPTASAASHPMASPSQQQQQSPSVAASQQVFKEVRPSLLEQEWTPQQLKQQPCQWRTEEVPKAPQAASQHQPLPSLMNHQQLQEHQQQLEQLPFSWRSMPALPQDFFTSEMQQGIRIQVDELQEHLQMRNQHLLAVEAQKLVSPSRFLELMDWVLFEQLQHRQWCKQVLDEAVHSYPAGSQELQEAQLEFDWAEEAMQYEYQCFQAFRKQMQGYHQAVADREQFRRQLQEDFPSFYQGWADAQD